MESIFARFNQYYIWSALAILAGVISPAIGIAKGLSCDQIFTAKAPLLTIQTSLGPIAIQGKVIETSNFSTDHKTNYLHLKLAAVLVPKDGIGHLFVIQRGDPNLAFDQLWRAALDRPRYFAKFEIFADENHLIVPDAIRLNIRNAGRIQFKDIPHTESQLYSNKDFEDALLKNTLLLASTENYFEHDRLQQHLMGVFALSNSTFKKVTEYIHFRRAFEKTSSKIDPKSFAGNKINYFTDIS